MALQSGEYLSIDGDLYWVAGHNTYGQAMLDEVSAPHPYEIDRAKHVLTTVEMLYDAFGEFLCAHDWDPADAAEDVRELHPALRAVFDKRMGN